MHLKDKEENMVYNNKVIQDDMALIYASDFIDFSKLKNKSILITGATGMIAYYFTCFLLYLNKKHAYNVKIYASVRDINKGKNYFRDSMSEENFWLIPYDVCSSFDLNIDVDYILHAASSSSPKYIVKDPLSIITANVNGTVNILEFARTKKISNILFTSTREVYGEVTDTDMIKEEDFGSLNPLDSRSCYPESKRMAEQLFKSYYNMYEVPFTIARIAHTYGPGIALNDGRIMSDLISNIVNDENIILKSDGSSERAFCYLTDTITALYAILLHGTIGESYNVSNETEEITIKQLSEMLLAVSESEKQIEYNILNSSNEYCAYKRVGLNTEKISCQLGWKPQVKLKTGLVKTIESFYHKKSK